MARDAGRTASAPQCLADVTSLHLQRSRLLDRAQHQSWVLECGATRVFSHELGDNLGFQHSSTATDEYGDHSDPVGAPAWLVESSAPKRAIAGWVSGAQVLDVSVGGSYSVSALEVDGTTMPQVLRLPGADTREAYYIGLRQAADVNVNLPTFYRNALSIHRSAGTLSARTYLVAVVAPRQSWSDATNGIDVTHQGLSGNVATVGIVLGGAVCARRAPTLSLSPATQSAAPGATLGYTLTVTKNDSAACPAAAINLAQQLPTGFNGTFGTASLSLAAGASGKAPWSVASSTSSTAPTFTLTAAATHSSSGFSANAQASYVVVSPPPPPSSTPPRPRLRPTRADDQRDGELTPQRGAASNQRSHTAIAAKVSSPLLAFRLTTSRTKS
jgi:hypothetical protein